MALTAEQKQAHTKYIRTTCERISIDVRKGKRDLYKAAAAKFNVSMAQLIQNSIDEYIANHADGEFIKMELLKLGDVGEALTAEQQQFLNKFEQLPPSTQAIVMKFIDNVGRLAASQELKGNKTDGTNSSESDGGTG